MGVRPVVVIGAGYVGLITAIGLVGLGHHVELLETRKDRREALRAGRVPIYEPGVGDILRPAVADGRLRVAAEPAEPTHEIALVCVGTPIDDDGRSDLRQLTSVLGSLRATLEAGGTVAIRSTVPVGGTRGLIEALGLRSDRLFLNPEFLRQGSALQDFLHPTRVVIGSDPGADPSALAQLEALMAGTGTPVLAVGYEEAELIKNSSNAFLALKLSFVNELAVLAEAYGGDVDRVLEGLALDPRIGGSYMRPSFGFGGSCLPKELQTLAVAGWERDVTMHVTTAASAANVGTQRHFAARVEGIAGGLSGRRLALLGLAFKAGTDDVRESPAIALASWFRDAGAHVVGFDPQAGQNACRELPWLELAPSAADALDGADVAVIATEWPEFAALDWQAVRARMASPIVVDGRRLLDGSRMRSLGYVYAAVGRSG